MVRKLRAVVTSSVALATLGAGALTLGGPAQADPVGGAFRTYVGVGSDTTQSVLDGLAGDVTGVTGVTKLIGSYDAFPQNTDITTRAGGPSFLRPSGSGNGVKALSDAITGTPWATSTGGSVSVTGQIDFARSSSGPSASGTDLTYVPFGRDAVAYAYRAPNGKVAKLTTAQLQTIYSANTPTTVNGVVVKPVLPQSSSGTRKFFLSAIGVTTIGSQVLQTTGNENDGSLLTQNYQIVPFSAAQWIAQKNGLATDTTAGDALGAPDNVGAVAKNTTTGLLSPRAAFYGGSFGRNVYNVIPTSQAVSTSGLGKLFVGTTSVLCKSAAQVVVKKFGFASLGSGCGATSVTGPLTP